MISSVLLDTKNGGLDGLANWPAGPYIVVSGLGEGRGSWQFAESQSCNVKRGLGCVFEKSGWYRALASFVCEEFKSSASISTKFHANFAEGHALSFFFQEHSYILHTHNSLQLSYRANICHIYS